VAVKVPTKSVMTIVQLHERPMLLTKWLAVVACLSLFFAGVPAFAGTEQRCTGLGSQCICGEPLNGATHDGGNSTFTPGQMYNMDDSQPPTQCFPWTASNIGTELYCNHQVTMIPASSFSSILPPGNTLSHVMRIQGGGICHITHPILVEQPNVTYCIRAYSRWDPSAPVVNEPAGQQQKIMTLGAEDPPGSGIVLNAQLSVANGNQIHTRFDGDMFNAPPVFDDLGNVTTDCTNNFCRFEICFDYSAIGEGRIRLRRTSVAPGSGQATSIKPVGTILRPQGIGITSQSGFGITGLAMYAQAMTTIRDNSHFIVTRVRPENRDFWPGPACEVEGGCSGSSAMPVAPTGLILK
jgi:hypothetical protein